jgi:ribonucleotide reductase alpha subunit
MATKNHSPRLSPNALTVLRQRYLAKNERGIVIESPSEMFHRVANDIASIEPPAHRRRLANQFYDAMASLTFLPNSPTLMNAGRPLQQLSACFVLPVDDSLESIFDAVKHQALIHQSGLPLCELREEIGRHESIQHLSQIPDDLRRLFVTAHDIAPAHHVRMQAVFQRHSDSGVSKTINLPPSATTVDVAAAFSLAYELGCKGLTVYRAGSRNHQVLTCSHVQSC